MLQVGYGITDIMHRLKFLCHGQASWRVSESHRGLIKLTLLTISGAGATVLETPFKASLGRAGTILSGILAGKSECLVLGRHSGMSPEEGLSLLHRHQHVGSWVSSSCGLLQGHRQLVFISP